MNIYYFTFDDKLPDLKYKYCIVKSSTLKDAKNYMFSLVGNEYGMYYSKQDWERRQLDKIHFKGLATKSEMVDAYSKS